VNVASIRSSYGNLPNSLSFCRLIGSPLLLPLANAGYKGWVLGWFLLMGLTDCLDGWIARRRRQASEFGAKLDGIADLVFYPCSALTLVILFPAYLIPNLPYIAATLVALGIVIVTSRWRCGRVILLHTTLARWSGVLVFLLFPASFVTDTTLAVRIVALLYMTAFLEGTAIFLRYGAVSADTRSIFSKLQHPAEVQRS